MTTRYDTIIVGAGHAGAACAAALRLGKYDGSIAIIGAEPDLPYQRPPLSKTYLTGAQPFAELLLRPERFWREHDVVLRLSTAILAVDADAHCVVTDTGETIGYGALVWAAGGASRRLACAGHDLAGVHTMRSRADADRMMQELPDVTRVVIVGGGYIGLEAAAVLNKSGKQVILLEAQNRVLARVAGEVVSRFFEAEHRAHGVDIRLGANVAALVGGSRVSGVRLDDGEVIAADMTIVGVGIVPAVEPLLAAGAVGGNGVVVDRQCRTTLPDVYAIGDCALHVSRYSDGAQIRVESVQNANDQASVVARAVLGQAVDYTAVPWFWSDQYDIKLQTIGLSAGYNQMVVRGDLASRSFTVAYLRDGHVLAFDCVNATRDYVQGRRLVVDRMAVDPVRLADPAVQLKAF